MTPEERIAKALAYLRGETERIVQCSKHPEGHSFVAGENPYDDLIYIQGILGAGE